MALTHTVCHHVLEPHGACVEAVACHRRLELDAAVSTAGPAEVSVPQLASGARVSQPVESWCVPRCGDDDALHTRSEAAVQRDRDRCSCGAILCAGSLGIRVRASFRLRSRDRSSDLVPDNIVRVTGSYGDMPGPVSTNYESPSTFWVNWTPALSNFGYNVSGTSSSRAHPLPPRARSTTIAAERTAEDSTALRPRWPPLAGCAIAVCAHCNVRVCCRVPAADPHGQGLRDVLP
jgi:hypothetical protein